MGIPLVDLKAQYASIKQEIDSAIQRVVSSTAFILGEEVKAFEEAFARYVGAKHAVGTSSGTSALSLALRACGVGQGDEVITTPMTFTATAEAICHVGARPVFVDIQPATFNIDPSRIEDAITPNTKALLPVHLYGNPCDMASIMDIARRHNLRVIEDAAQAHGATYRGAPVGTIGDVGCFSFYPGKNLGAYGDAGAVVTNDDEIAARVRLLRDHGRKTKYEHLEVGYGERLDALQAAILRAKLGHLEQWTALRRKWAALYSLKLSELPVRVVQPTPDSEPVYHIFAVESSERDRLLEWLNLRSIRAGVHYPIPLHLQPAYSFLGYKAGVFPVAERAAKQEISLPMYPELGESGVDEVVGAISGFFKNSGRSSLWSLGVGPS